jgi:hypothetical protein
MTVDARRRCGMHRAAARADGGTALRPWHVERRGGLRLWLAQRAGLVVMGRAVVVVSADGRPVVPRRADDEESRIGVRGRRGGTRKPDGHDEAVEEQQGCGERGNRPTLATKQSESSPAYGHGRKEYQTAEFRLAGNVTQVSFDRRSVPRRSDPVGRR